MKDFINKIQKNKIEEIIGILILAVIFLFPAYLIRFSILEIPFTLLECLIYTLFLVWVFKKIFYKEALFISSFLKGNKILSLGLILFFFGAALATDGSSNKEVSLGLLKAYFFDPFIFFIVIVDSFKFIDIKRIKSAILSSGVVLATVSFYYLLTQNMTYDGRLEFVFNSPNFLAMALAPAIILLIPGLFFGDKNRKDFVVSLTLLGFLALPFLATHSYGAFFGIFVALFSIIILKDSRVLHKFLFFGLAVFMALGILFFESNNIKNFLRDDRSSFASRVMIWNASIEILKDNYILGVGPGMFQDNYLSYKTRFSQPYLEWAVPYPHNVFLAFFVQNGLMGFLGFLILLFWIFKELFKILREKAIERKDALFVFGFFIYFVVHGLVDTPYWKNDLSLWFFLFLALVVLMRKK